MDSAGDHDRISALPDHDRISALPDELLHLILASVREATAVTRTATLSRRWRHVWIHAPCLALSDTTVTSVKRGGFVGFVNWVLAQRGNADIGSLDIGGGAYRKGCCAPPERVNAWLRYAMRRVVKSFSLSLTGQPPPRGVIRRRPVVLPSHGRMASLTLYLSVHDGFRLPPVPAAARYEALTELRLSASFDEKAAPGGGRRTLGDFVSSCCPRLRKLDICAPTGLPQLVIRSETLEELTLFLAEDLRILDVTAPSMRVLKLKLCFSDPKCLDGNEQVAKNVVRIAAPRLTEIAMHNRTYDERPELDIQHPASVRRLSDIHLDMHGPYCFDNEGGLWLLENCPGVEHIAVTIDHGGGFGSNRHLVDLTSERAAPFASVRSMAVRARSFSDKHLVSSISSLLSRCPRLRSLSIDTTGTEKRSWKCFCDEVDTWKFHRKFSLGYLEEVTIRGFLGADEDMELLTLLFEGSNSIRNLTLHAITSFPGHVSLERMMAEEDEKDTESIVQKLMKIPHTDRGCWRFGKDATWTSYATEKDMDHGRSNSA